MPWPRQEDDLDRPWLHDLWAKHCVVYEREGGRHELVSQLSQNNLWTSKSGPAMGSQLGGATVVSNRQQC